MQNNWNTWRRFNWNNSPPAATYYLDPWRGNDAHAGTSLAAAWATGAKAESVTLTAGQSIVKRVPGELIPYKKAAASSAGQGLVIAYYQTGNPSAVPLGSIDWSALTHISHDHIEPAADGSLDTSHMTIAPTVSAALIAAAHANGVKVLINIADIAYEQTYPPLAASSDPFAVIAASPTLLGVFVGNLVQFVLTNGYDGIDIDWEYGQTSLGVLALMAALYPAIKAQNPNLHVNMAIGGGNSLCWAGVQQFTDTFTVMCYDLYLTAGRVTWFNAPLYGGEQFTYYSLRQPSVEQIVTSLLQLGVPRTQMLLGAPFYGYVFSRDPNPLYDGAAVPLTPRQPYAANYLPQVYTPYNQIPYSAASDNWDDLAQEPYLGIAGTDPSLNRYVSYDDCASLSAKIAWAQAEGLGGLAAWELSLDYFPSRSIVSPLLNTIKVSYPKTALVSVTPPAPSGLTAAAVSGTSATLNWPPVSSATGYHVKRSAVGGSGYTVLATVTAPGYTDSTLTAGQTYYYEVSALSNAVEGSNSAPLAVTATTGGAPAAPSGLTLSAAAPTNTYGLYTATLAWSAVSGAASYRVKRSAGTSGSGYAYLAAAAALTFTDSTLTPGAAWHYVVTAVSSAGLESPASAEVSTATPAVYAPPNALASPAAIDAAPGR